MSDHDVHGLAVIRLVDAPQHVVEWISAQFGPAGADPERQPDLTISFVDEVRPQGYLRLLGLNQAAFDDEHFYLLDGHGRRCRVDMGALGGPTELVCDRRADRIPILIPVLGLCLLEKGYVLLHAASLVHEGKGILIAGWQKGGKTETLLPFMAAGAHYVADEWTIVGGTPTALRGVANVARIWDWHFRYLPVFWSRIKPQQRLRLRVARAYRALYSRQPVLDRLSALPGLQSLRQASIEGGSGLQAVDQIDPATMFGEHVWQGPAPLDRIFLPVLGEDRRTYVVPTTARRVAERMVSSLAFERAELTTAYQQFRFAFPERSNPLIENVRERELEVLTQALGTTPALELRHPYPVPLPEMLQAAEEHL